MEQNIFAVAARYSFVMYFYSVNRHSLRRPKQHFNSRALFHNFQDIHARRIHFISGTKYYNCIYYAHNQRRKESFCVLLKAFERDMRQNTLPLYIQPLGGFSFEHMMALCICWNDQIMHKIVNAAFYLMCSGDMLDRKVGDKRSRRRQGVLCIH